MAEYVKKDELLAKQWCHRDIDGQPLWVVDVDDIKKAPAIEVDDEKKDDLRVVLEEEKVDGGLPNETYYLYGVGGYWLEFTQDRENGNIHRAYVWAKEKDSVKNENGIRFLVDSERNLDGGYYPNVFGVDLAFHYMSAQMNVEDAKVFANKLVEATVVMDKIQCFFESSKHYELYCSKHGKGIEDVIANAKHLSEARSNEAPQGGRVNEGKVSSDREM